MVVQVNVRQIHCSLCLQVDGIKVGVNLADRKVNCNMEFKNKVTKVTKVTKVS